MGELALAWDCRPSGDSETSVAFLEVVAVERLRDLVCLATGVDKIADKAGSCRLLWEIGKVAGRAGLGMGALVETRSEVVVAKLGVDPLVETGVVVEAVVETGVTMEVTLL